MSSVVGAESAIYGSKESNIQEVARLSSESQEILRSNDSLQDLQNELQQFLSHHISRLNSMRKGLSSANVECNSSANLSRNDVLSAEALCDYPPNVQSGSGIRDFQRSPSLEEFDAHNALLARFLETHIANLRNLQKKLSENGNQETMVQDIRSHVIGEKQYRALSEQFNMLVIISTFTAALIIAFLSLANDIIGPEHRITFSFGMLLSFLAMAVHLGTIIVAGRGAALTSQHQAGEEPIYDLAYFHLYLSLCEQLQFVATILFIVSIIVLSFFIFASIAFPLVLLALAVVGSLLVFWSVYWRVSITLRNLKLLLGGIRKLRERRYRR